MAHVEDAARVLELLEILGLKGQKLAVFDKDGEAISRQVAVRLGIECGQWLVDFINGMIKEAVATRDLEQRVQGDLLPETHQRISDAIGGMEKEEQKRRSAAASEEVKLMPPKKGKLEKIWRPRRAPVVEESEKRSLIIGVLLEELKLYGAPILDEMQKSLNPDRAADSLLGKYRPSTVRRYLSYWQSFRKWVFASTGRSHPGSGVLLADYLYAREEEGMGCSIPMAVMKSVSWFEKVACIPEDESLVAHPMCKMVVADLTIKLEDAAPPVRRAPRLLSIFIPALEYVVMDRTLEDHIRVAAWLRLLKMWASLRFDDLANVRRALIRDYDGKLGGVLKKTKTTGAGKRVRELPIYVSEFAYVAEKDWLDTGLRVLKRLGTGDGEYLVGEGLSIGSMDTSKMLSYQEAVILSSNAMDEMRGEAPGSPPLIPAGWSRFWTEHSERSALSSGLASLGIVKSDRDLLGRWSPEGSDQYIRTYNSVVGRMQHTYAVAVRRGDAYHRLDEGAVLEDLKTWLKEKWGVDPTEASLAVEAWKGKISTSGPFQNVLAREEGEGTPTEVAESTPGSPCDSGDPTDIESEHAVKRPKMSRLEESRTGGFIVVYNRINRGMLHRAGPDGCWMARTREFKKAEIFATLPDEVKYTTRCRLCWSTREGESESTSDTDEELDVPGNVLERHEGLFRFPIVE